jgi:hypothetical protein
MGVIFSDDNNKKSRWRESGNGNIVVSLGQMHSGVIESPQFGLIMVKGQDQDPGRHKIAN